MQIEIGTVIVSGLVQTGIGFLFWFAVQRTVERVDKLQGELAELKDRRVTGIEDALKEHTEANETRFEKHTAARKEIYGRIEALERNKVESTACREMMREIAAGMAEYRAAVIDLAKVQESVRNLAGFVSEVNQRVISTMTDLAEQKGRQPR